MLWCQGCTVNTMYSACRTSRQRLKVFGDTARSPAIDTSARGEPTRSRSSSKNTRMVFTSCSRENSTTSSRIRSTAYWRRQRWVASSPSASCGSGKPPRCSSRSSAASGASCCCSHHSRTETGCRRSARFRPTSDSPTWRKVSMRALRVTSTACPSARASITPLSQAFQPRILWISSKTSRRARGFHDRRRSTVRSPGMSQFKYWASAKRGISARQRRFSYLLRAGQNDRLALQVGQKLRFNGALHATILPTYEQ
jgi:hypothetical protein